MRVSGGSSGAFKKILETTVSNESALDLTDLEAGYRYLIEFDQVYSSLADKLLLVQMSTNNGSSFISGASYYYETRGTDGATGTAETYYPVTGNINGSNHAYKAAGELRLVGIGSDVAIFRSASVYGRVGAYPQLTGGGRLIDNSGTNAARLAMSGGNLYGTFTVWRY